MIKLKTKENKIQDAMRIDAALYRAYKGFCDAHNVTYTWFVEQSLTEFLKACTASDGVKNDV
jgi:hypothetical protein